MTTAVDISMGRRDMQALAASLLYKNFCAIAALHPQERFLFIFDRPYGNLQFAHNITPVVAGPPAGNTLLRYYWYRFKLPALLRRYGAGLFAGLNGRLAPAGALPQCLIVTDAMAMAWQAAGKLPPACNRASRIIVTSATCRQVLLGLDAGIAAKTVMVHPMAGEGLAPAGWQQREALKEKYAGGREYFLHAADIDTPEALTSLLKAFSLFKKRQKSNMLLVLAGRVHPGGLLDTYKYRHEVKLRGWLPAADFAGLLAGAYALVQTRPALQLPASAMLAGVPVVAADSPLLREVCGDAALFAAAGDPAALAAELMQVFKDEDLRNRLIQAGAAQAAPYRAPAATALLAEAVLHTGNA